MKKEERLYRLFGDIDDDLVAQAAGRVVPIKVWLPRVTAVAAAVALVVGLAVAQPWNTEKPPVSDGTATTSTVPEEGTTEDTTTTVKNNAEQTEIGIAPPLSTATDRPADTTTVKPTYTTQVGGTPTTTANGGEIRYEPKWDEKPIWQQFPEFERFGQPHTVRAKQLDASQVGEHLENVFLRGHDIYTDTEHEIEGQLYRIKGISDACAVALQYEGSDKFYPAVNREYTPETLGELIADVNLREHLRVGTVYHTYRDEDGTIHDKEYAGLTVETVWEMLLSDTSATNVADDYEWPTEWKNKMSIRIDVPLLDYTNISISLSEEGYLITNLLDAGKIFYIGEDKVAAFMEYVEEHCRLQKDDELIALPGDTTADNGTTMTSAAQPPLVTGTTMKGN